MMRVIAGVARTNMAHTNSPLLPCLLCCMQAWMMRVSAGVTRANMAHTDERSKLESELVAGVDVVKCYAWEVGPCFYILCGG